MTDRELLELAAKAAGVPMLEYAHGGIISKYPSGRPWNPLTDDGDALRLAVRIGMVVNTTEGISTAFVGRHTCVVEPHGRDPDVATRRAITRAAAEIGKQR